MENHEIMYNADGKILRRDLYRAVTRGDLIFLRKLLMEENFHISMLFIPAKSACYCTPLAEAARLGHLELVEELAPYYEKAGYLESGCPLHIACKFDCMKVIEFLVKRIPRFVNEVNCHPRFLPIQLAAMKNDVELIQIFLNAGGNIDETSSRSCGKNPFDQWKCPYHFGGFMSLSTYPQRYPALFLAIWGVCQDAVTRLLVNGASTVLEVGSNEERSIKKMTQADGNKISAFSLAILRNSSECLGILIKHTILAGNIAARAVYVALTEGNVECLNLLLENGAPTPSLEYFSEDEMINLWCKIISPRITPSLLTTDTIEMLLNSGTSMAPLATIDSDRLCNILIDVRGSVLEWILNMGLFELRYFKQYQNGGSEASSKLKRQDYTSLMTCFTYNQEFKKLGFILHYFPGDLKHDMIFNEHCQHEDWSVVNALVLHNAPYERVQKACSLLRISKWAIRSQFVEKYGFVPYRSFPRLRIPVSLEDYLRRGVC